ncbi:hypothetical protein RHP75_01035 [Pseudomonas sp. SG20056]|uniref:hypothetical protein n=1 Tax=Pseudomonas sp. SG20056 TaxID=3074146 RepID=UPI00287F78A6|nr:hypothetical protein [Pseudomonas sp. SG20056]WNF47052.1 hypothetical protein RHP75_01035 [Pseudomonas sp. SG20056]
MTRTSDIEEILKEVEEVISTISVLYENAKTDSTVTQISKAKIKSVLEHLRSILDYCALEIYLHVYGKKLGNCIFRTQRTKLYSRRILPKISNHFPRKIKRSTSSLNLYNHMLQVPTG